MLSSMPRYVTEERDSLVFRPAFFFLELSPAFQSLPKCCPLFLVFWYFALYSLPFLISQTHFLFKPPFIAPRPLPFLCSSFHHFWSRSLIMFYLWAQATFRLKTKHRGKHWNTFFEDLYNNQCTSRNWSWWTFLPSVPQNVRFLTSHQGDF